MSTKKGINRMVQVIWVDTNILHGWQEGFGDCPMAGSTDVGYLVHEDDDKIILVRGISQYGMFNSPMAIPKGCVKSVRDLRLK